LRYFKVNVFTYVIGFLAFSFVTELISPTVCRVVINSTWQIFTLRIIPGTYNYGGLCIENSKFTIFSQNDVMCITSAIPILKQIC